MTTYNEKQKGHTLKYMKEKQKRIPLDWLKSDYEQRILPAIEYLGSPVNTFIKTAIIEKLIRDGALSEDGTLVKEIRTLANKECNQETSQY